MNMLISKTLTLRRKGTVIPLSRSRYRKSVVWKSLARARRALLRQIAALNVDTRPAPHIARNCAGPLHLNEAPKHLLRSA
ncbi:MAG: hypothetical protein Q8S27_20500, partial [Hoeflea sp.]|nr:hypothetical protein [Hoeflea sp.]